MVNLKKVMSCTLAVAMVMGAGAVMAGCNKSSSSKAAETIKEDDPWFNTKQLKLDADYDPEQYSYIGPGEPIITDDLIIMNYLAEKNFDYKEAMKDGFDISALISNDVCVFGKDGKLQKKIELSSALNSDKNKVAELSSIVRSGNDIMVYYTVSDAKSGDKAETYSAVLDIEAGKIKDPQKIEVGDNYRIASVTAVGKYSVICAVNYSENDASFRIVVKEGEKEIQNVDLSEEFKGRVYNVDTFALDRDGKLTFIVYGEETKKCVLDLASGKVEGKDEVNYMSMRASSFTDENGDSYYIDFEGLKKMNTEGGDDEIVCSLGDCNINLNHVSSSKIVDIKGDSVYLTYTDYGMSGLAADTTLYILEKADKNPNAGKKVLNARAMDDNLMADEAEGIRLFNETNKDYFVKVSFSNNTELYEAYSSDDDAYTSENKANSALASMTNELAVDLMAGTGPDIILNAAGLSELENSEYLEDLNQYLNGENGVDKKDYFVNVLDSAEIDGKLYNLPLSFAVQGIGTSTENVAEGKQGFTFDEYTEFVDKVCNGVDPISMGHDRISYFGELVAPMMNVWIKDGKVDFDTDEFRKLAEFVKDHVQEDMAEDPNDYSVSIDEMGNLQTDYQLAPANALYLYDISAYFSNIGDAKELGMYGYPSYDGRGASIASASSAAISAKSNEKEGCWEFVKTLMSEDVQSEGDCNVININAEKKIVDRAYEDYASTFNLLLKQGLPENQIISLGISKPNEDAKETYLKIVESTNVSSTTDPAVMNVLNEELQGYFAGQKSIDDAIKTINDRAQTVVDERK